MRTVLACAVLFQELIDSSTTVAFFLFLGGGEEVIKMDTSM